MLDFPFERFRPIRPDRRQYQPILVTPPASSPVTLAEAKAHLVVDFNDDDALVQGLVDGAVSYLDGFSGVLCRALCAQTWRQDFDVFDFYLKLPLSPVISIDSVKYD